MIGDYGKKGKTTEKGGPAFLVVLTRVELAAHEVHVSLESFNQPCDMHACGDEKACSSKLLATTKTKSSFLMFLSVVELAALKVHVPLPRHLLDVWYPMSVVHAPPQHLC